MYKSVIELETDVTKEINERNYDSALVMIIRFVEFVISDSRGTATIFGCENLDRLCQRIGAEVLEINMPPLQEKKWYEEEVKEKPEVFIATELMMTGGHTAIIEDIIKAQPEKKYLILLTDLYNSCDLESIQERFALLKVFVERAPSGPALTKLTWLQKQLTEIMPSRIYLLNHYQDAVAISAVQPGNNRQVIFIHHADHHLCLGVYLPDAVHVDLHNLGYFNCRNQLGLMKNRYWPLVVEDLGRRPPQPPFLGNGKLRTATSGHKSKFEEPYLYAYSEVVPKLLDVTRGVHIHIGELSQKTLESIDNGLKKFSINKDRFIYIPWVKSIWKAVIEHRVDLYISSFPLGGGRAAIEVMGSGTPMAMHESYVSRFHGGLDIAYPEVFSWRKPSELYSYVQNNNLDILITQGNNARKHYEQYHTPDRFKQEIEKLELGVEGLQPLPLRNYSKDNLQIFLDHAVTDHVVLNQQITIRDHKIAQMNQLLFLKDDQIHEREPKIKQLEATVQGQQGELNRIYSSPGWKLLKVLRKAIDLILPENTKRRKIYNLIFNYLKHGARRDWTAFMKRLKFDTTPNKLANDVTYRSWILQNEPSQAQLKTMRIESQAWAYRPKISLITPIYNPDKSHFIQCIKAVLAQSYDNWELCLADGGSDRGYVRRIIKNYARQDSRIKYVLLPKNKGIAGNSNEALKLTTGDFVGFLDHDDMLPPFALYEVVKLLNQDRTVDLIYSDEDKVSAKGTIRYQPFFKPGWSPDTFLSYNYLNHFTVIRRELIEQLGGFRDGYDGAQDYDLMLRVVQNTDQIRHIPKILYHWRSVSGSAASQLMAKPYALDAAKRAIGGYLKRRGFEVEISDGQFPTSYRVKYKIRSFPHVSIIIPTRDMAHLLSRCVSSILEKTEYKNYEILIVDNQSQERETHEFFKMIQKDEKIKVIPYDKPFNYAALNNEAVRHAKYEYLLFLNNDTEVISGEWLSAMLEFAQREDVGSVGAKLYYPDGTIQHGGVIIGLGGFADHGHRYMPGSSPGDMGRLKVIQNLSAVTAACMMVRKKVFEEVNGFDERLSHDFNDVDLCLKIREKGYLIVFTPYAELYHHELKSRGNEERDKRHARSLKDGEYLRNKWKQVFEKVDPYYNPNLSLGSSDFRINI